MFSPFLPPSYPKALPGPLDLPLWTHLLVRTSEAPDLRGTSLDRASFPFPRLRSGCSGCQLWRWLRSSRGLWRPLARADRERRSARGAYRRTESRGATQGVTLVLSLCVSLSCVARGPRASFTRAAPKPVVQAYRFFKPIAPQKSPGPAQKSQAARLKFAESPIVLIKNEVSKKIAIGNQTSCLIAKQRFSFYKEMWS